MNGHFGTGVGKLVQQTLQRMVQHAVFAQELIVFCLVGVAAREDLDGLTHLLPACRLRLPLALRATPFRLLAPCLLEHNFADAQPARVERALEDGVIVPLLRGRGRVASRVGGKMVHECVAGLQYGGESHLITSVEVLQILPVLKGLTVYCIHLFPTTPTPTFFIAHKSDYNSTHHPPHSQAYILFDR